MFILNPKKHYTVILWATWAEAYPQLPKPKLTN